MTETDETRPAYRRHQLAGLVLGPVLFAAIGVLPAPAGLSAAGWATGSVAVLMAMWWATEALPLAATALLPLALFPLLGVLDAQQTAERYMQISAMGLRSSGQRRDEEWRA